MNRKRWTVIVLGTLAASAIFLGGWIWYGASARGESTTEMWDDLCEVRGVGDLLSVVSGEKARVRRILEAKLAEPIELNGPESGLGPLDRRAELERILADSIPEGIPAPTIAPMFGGTPSRNMVNTIDKNIPKEWSIEEGKSKNIKWSVQLGTYTYSSPVIADGKVFIGTNNHNPRDAKDKAKIGNDKAIGDKAVIMAFNQADGKFLWQLVHDMAEPGQNYGQVTSPTVEGKRLYYLTPGCVAVCADTDGKIQWTLDMVNELKVHPFHVAASSPIVVGDLIFLVTGNGRDEEEKLPSPKAPSFIAINKKTGKTAWHSNLPGEKIIQGQWTNPTLATVNGKPQIIFPGGDAVLYSFDPEAGKLIWKCDCNPTRPKPAPYFVGTPVVVGDRLYVGLGVAPDVGTSPRFSYFLCLDVTKQGDVSFKSHDANAADNKKSALVWAFGGKIDPAPKKGRAVNFGSTISTACVHDGLVYIPESSGYLHCLDAKTGVRYWDHDFKTSVWGSAYYVDSKVYVATEDGEVIVFAPGKRKIELAKNGLDEAIFGTPVVAGGVMYIATKTKLYAIR